MSAKTNYAENKIIDWLFRGQSLTPPATWYVGLFTSNPSDAGNDGVEASGGNYARVAVANNLTNWAGTQGAGTTTVSSGTSGTTSNNVTVTFPTLTADIGTAVGFGLWDAPIGGNLWVKGALTQSKPLLTGDTPEFPPGTLQYQEDD